MTKKQARRQTAKRYDRAPRKSTKSQGRKPVGRKTGPSKKEVGTFAALLKRGHNKRN